jgi:hypothetical protein
VIEDLTDHGLISVIAVLRPVRSRCLVAPFLGCASALLCRCLVAGGLPALPLPIFAVCLPQRVGP